MSKIEAHGAQGVDILPLQHQGYDRAQGNLGAWDVDYRAHKRCVRIKGRRETGGMTGQWEYDPESVGDLLLGLCWRQDPAARPFPGWSFGWPTVISVSGSGGTPTPGGGGGAIGLTPTLGPLTPTGGGSGGGGGIPRPAGGKKSGQMAAQPVGDQSFKQDGRFNPINVPAFIMRGQGPGENAVGGQPGGQQGGGPRNGQAGQRPVMHLGIGAQVHSLSGGFAQFSGVRTNFSGGGFAQFQGVRTNFSSGSGRTGAQFTFPRNARR